MKRKDIIEKLRNEMLLSTGIDLEKYRKPELLAKMSDLLMFPLYALQSIILPLALVLLVFASVDSVYFMRTPSILGGLLIVLFGIPIFFVIGISVGILRLIRRIGNDLRAIISEALSLGMGVADDIEQSIRNLSVKGTSAVQAFPSPSQIVRGVLLVVLLPTVEQVISRKVKLLGPTISGVAGKILFTVAETLFNTASTKIENSSVVVNADNKIGSVSETVSSRLTSVTTNATNASNKLRDTVTSYAGQIGLKSDSVISTACGTAALPFKYLLIVALVSAAILLWCMF